MVRVVSRYADVTRSVGHCRDRLPIESRCVCDQVNGIINKVTPFGKKRMNQTYFEAAFVARAIVLEIQPFPRHGYW
jgi:hypothetical protein